MLSSLTSTLEQTDDWVLQVDLSLPKDGQRAKEPFPAHIGNGEFATATRPDILIYSDKIQTLIYIELTSPWEANMSQAHRGKMKKYADEGLHAIPGWTTIPLCVEVGARGTTLQHIPPHVQDSRYAKTRVNPIVQEGADHCRTVQLLSLP